MTDNQINATLTVGMSWAHLRRRLSGQARVDEVDHYLAAADVPGLPRRIKISPVWVTKFATGLYTLHASGRLPL